MYFLEQFQRQFSQTVFLRAGEENFPIQDFWEINAVQSELQWEIGTEYKESPWYQKLDTKQQEQLNTLFSEKHREVTALISKLDEIDSKTEFKRKLTYILEKGLLKLGKPKDREELDETTDFEERVIVMQADIQFYIKQIQLLERKLATLEQPGAKESRQKQLVSKYKDLFEGKEGTLETEIQEEVWHILDGRSDFDILSAWDFYAIKQSGYDLSKLLLAREWQGGEINIESIKENDKFVVNFWKNPDLDAIIGAGDVLPILKVETIKVNGTQWTRQYNPRPWYYTPDGKYLDIHDGDRIEVVSIKPIEEETPEYEAFVNAWKERYTFMRGGEILRKLQEVTKGISPNDTEINFPYTSKKDKELFEDLIKEKLPDFLEWKVVLEWWKIQTKGDFTVKEFVEVINEYKETMFALSEHIQDKKLWWRKNIQIEKFSEIVWFKKPLKKELIEHSLLSFSWLSEEEAKNTYNYTYDSSTDEFTLEVREGTIGETFGVFGQHLDLTSFASEYPREASLKNNNPSGLTYNLTFSRTLNSRGIKHSIWTARPSSEGGNYFSFPTIGEGIRAHNLLWQIKMRRAGGTGTLWDLISTWAVDTTSYQRNKVIQANWNTPVSQIRSKPEIYKHIQLAQLKIESPGMYNVLEAKWLLRYYHRIQP